MKLIKVLILSFLLLPLISANGLNIISENSNINKTYQIDKTFTFEVRNEENFAFKNITFEQDWMEVTKFSLDSGQSKNITAKITRDSNFNGQITLIGDYYNNIGSSNITEEVEITNNEDVIPCNLNLVVGDKVTWINNYLGDVRLVNTNSNQQFLTIPEGESRTLSMNNPQTLNYQATWVGICLNYPNCKTCKINVQDTNEWTHNSNYDDTLTLNLNIIYETTTISINIPKTNYEIEYDEEKEDILTIENTGNEDAKNIHLSGEWFEFDENDFDLDVGDSRNIGYTINPYITNTSQTDRNHTIELKITGNFNDYLKDFKIFIPYHKISSGFSGDIDDEVLQEFIKSYCQDNLDICLDLFINIFPNYYSDSDSVNGTSSSLLTALKEIATIMQEIKTGQKTIVEENDNLKTKVIDLTNQTSEIKQDQEGFLEKLEDNTISTWALIIGFLALVFFGLFFIVIKQEKFNSFRKKLKMSKNER